MSAVLDSVTLPGLTAPAIPSEPPPLLLLSAALDDPRVGHVIFDSELRVTHVTSQTARLLDLQPGEPAEPLTMLQLLSRSALEKSGIDEAKAKVAEFGSDQPEISVLLRSEDRTRYVRMRLRGIASQFGVASFELGAAEDEKKKDVSEFALRDSLTGLASRHFFEDTMAKLLARTPSEPLTLLLLDLDRFKAVNDTLGHSAGDALLRLASERLKAAVRKDDIVARLGGDEFAVLIHPASKVEETRAIAERILDLVQRTYLIEGQLVNIGTSIGIAEAPADGNHPEALLRNADLALYHSKSSGRSTYHFFEEHMERRAQARRTSELELRRALALRQLELFYQPQIDTKQGALVGFEALIRWRHPEKGMIPPCDFLPIAEEIGVIVPIGDWVLRTACREAMRWPSHITVAVNASPLQFYAGNFAESVKRALQATGLPGERLEIEITEGIMLRNDEAILKTLHDLRAMNVRIAMDDFGTGYASLSQLARFPFDKIKIDRSLAGFEGENPKQRSIVRAITALGQSLGVATLAEGVEDAQQLARLQSDGCTSVQGYFFSRPVPTSQLPEILKRFAPGV
jgi:diguanylate cyclase (GGDEF)-like protein